MSAFTDLQAAIADYLGRRATGTLGNGTDRELRWVHGMDTDVLTLKVMAGETELVEGEDFRVGLVDHNQLLFTALGEIPAADAWTVTAGVLRVAVPIVERRDATGAGREIADQIRQAVGNHGLCINVIPPLPRKATQGVMRQVFFGAAEIQIVCIEKPAISRRYGCDVYDLMDDVATALNGRAFPEISPNPLQIAPVPVRLIGEALQDRAFSVVFHVPYGISRRIPQAG